MNLLFFAVVEPVHDILGTEFSTNSNRAAGTVVPTG